MSFPKFGNGVVAFFALTPLLVAVHGIQPGQPFRLSGLNGALCSLPAVLGRAAWNLFARLEIGSTFSKEPRSTLSPGGRE